MWVRTYIEKHQARDQHAIICGEAVLGDIHAAPSIDRVDDWQACLLDCDDMTRVDRLRQRGTGEPNMHMLCWAAWLRVHALDPTWARDVIQSRAIRE